jgi:hypothetical protein
MIMCTGFESELTHREDKVNKRENERDNDKQGAVYYNSWPVISLVSVLTTFYG